MARTDIKEEYGSNVLANKIFESAEKEAQQAFEQIQKPFNDISFEVPTYALENIQISQSISFSENKFFYLSPDSGTYGVWIKANERNPEIKVNLNNHSVTVLDEFNGNNQSAPGSNTLVAGKNSGEITIEAKDVFINRTAGGIIHAYSGGFISIRANDSIFLSVGKENNSHRVISNYGSKVELTSKNIAIKTERGGIIEANGGSQTFINSESLFIEQTVRGPSWETIIAREGSTIDITAKKDIYLKGIDEPYCFLLYSLGSKIDIKAVNAYLEGIINASSGGQIYIDAANLYLKSGIESYEQGRIDLNASEKAVINGHIYSESGSIVNINFGDDGLLRGASFVEKGSESNFSFGTGSVWLINALGPLDNFSSVSNLTLKESFLDFTGNTDSQYVILVSEYFDSKSAVALMDVFIGQEKLNDQIIVNKT